MVYRIMSTVITERRLERRRFIFLSKNRYADIPFGVHLQVVDKRVQAPGGGIKTIVERLVIDDGACGSTGAIELRNDPV